MRHYTLVKIKFILVALVIVSSITTTNAVTEKYENFSWKSPNAWEGAIFDVPTWFAKDMNYTGREVIRFHDGFYDKKSTGFWTYAFALLVTQIEQPTTTALLDETKRYFIGLARGIGDKNSKYYPADKIKVKAISAWSVSKQSKYRSQIYTLESFDPFTTGKPIKLNVKITTWLCSDKVRAIHYSLSPQPLKHAIWNELNTEVDALKCW